MIILTCDTSTKSLSVALCDGEKSLAQKTQNTGLVHSRSLVPLIQEIFGQAGIEPGDIDCLGCTTGPGSFTGIRIGICVIKGMAYALGKPAAGVSTLTVLARPFTKKADLIIPMIDARNRRVFSGYFSHRRELKDIHPEEASRSVDDLLTRLGGHLKRNPSTARKILFCGDAAAQYENDREFRTALEHSCKDSCVREVYFTASNPEAYHTAQLIYERYQKDPDAFPGDHDPFFLTENYLIPSGAERIRNKS